MERAKPISEMKIKNDFLINKKDNKMSELYPEVEVEFAEETSYPTAGIKLPKDFNLNKIINECIDESGYQEDLIEQHQENPEEGLKLFEEREKQKKESQKERFQSYRDKLKADTDKYEEFKEKQRQYQKWRYQKLKEEGKLESMNEARKKRYNEKKGEEAFEKKRQEARTKYLEKVGKVKCECGVEYQNISHKKERHLKSDKHQMYMLLNNPDFKKEETIPEDVRSYLETGGRRTKKEIDEMAEKNGGMRGSYHCSICDINIHLTKTDLKKHFNSNNHLKNFVKNKSA